MTVSHYVLAVLITSHNRSSKTFACLHSLFSQQLPTNFKLRAFLVDDASRDGTSAMVRQQYPQVRLLVGTGNLFWCGGMRLAWQEAAQENPDFYLWLNDDSYLLPGAIQQLLKTAVSTSIHPLPAVVVGSCQDPETKAFTYGGQIRPGLHPGRLIPVIPNGNIQRCDTFEGNVVLVPRLIFEKVGLLDSFCHAMGDTDYGYRVTRAGFVIRVAPTFVALCARNPPATLPISRFDSLRAKMNRKSLPPMDWWKICCRHAGWVGPFFWAWSYLKPLISPARPPD
jgi:GT2 family glycosyltransferase